MGGRIAEREIFFERTGIDFRADVRNCQDGFCLGREGKARSISIEIERFDPEAIAPDHQAPALGVPKREAEHTLEMPDEVHCVLLVEMDEHLSVAAGPKSMSATEECVAQLVEIIDLAVAQHP